MSRREALAALARRYPEEYRRIYAALKDGRPVDEVTVTEWAEQWLTMRERIVRPGSLAADKAAVTKYQLGQPAPCGHPRPNATDKRMSTVEILEEFEWILPFTDPESAAARVGTSLDTIKTYYRRTGRIVPKRLKPEPSHGLTKLRGPR